MRGWLLRVAYALLQLKWRVLRPITLGVRLAPLQDRRVLLVRHTYQSGWHLPGGAMNRGETPLQAAKREAYEEAGVRCNVPPRLLDIYSSFDDGKNDHVAVYVATDFRVEQPSDRWEIADVQWFHLDSLPADTSPATRRWIGAIISPVEPGLRRWHDES